MVAMAFLAQMVRAGGYWIDGEAGDPRAVSALLDRLLSAEARPLQVYKDEPGRSRVEAYADGERRWIVKRYRMPPWRAQVAMALRVGPAWVEWRGGLRLARAGLRVCRPVAIAYQAQRGDEATALVYPWCGEQTLHHLLRDGGPRPAALAAYVGAQAGRMLAAGYVNRDHKTGNLMIDEAALRGEAPPWIIDAVAIRPRWRQKAAHQMLATLYRTARRAGAVRRREMIEALRAARAADARLALLPLREQIRRIAAMAEAGSS